MSKKPIQIMVSEEFHRRLMVACAQRGVKAATLARKLLWDWVNTPTPEELLKMCQTGAVTLTGPITDLAISFGRPKGEEVPDAQR
jgi:hypothetical protein